jgi:hypothetical protein
MTWWQAGIVGWIAASLALAFVLSRASTPLIGRARHRTDPSPEVLGSILGELRAVIEEAEHDPEPHSGPRVQELLTEGYGVYLSLEAEWRRLGREIEDLLDTGGEGADAEIAKRARRRRQVERERRQLRQRLDSVWSLTHDRPPGGAVR